MIQLTGDALRKIFPQAPQDVLDAFLAKQYVLTKAGINHTRTRLAYFLANVEHETSGFSIPNLTESTAYTARRAAQVWPNRFGSAADCYHKVGSWEGDPEFSKKLINQVYGGRMGNGGPGSGDGFRFRGRGGPQWTGRDGYTELQKRTGLPAVVNPDLAAKHDVQPEVCSAFWDWKGMNPLADTGNFRGCVKRWNGGYNGLADREARMKGNDPYIARLVNVDVLRPILKGLPGAPPTPAPPKDVIDAATKEERAARTAGAAATLPAGASEGAKHTGAVQPENTPLLPSMAAWTIIGIGVAVVVITAVIIARKKAAVISNWF
jgi:predicted chitinase